MWSAAVDPRVIVARAIPIKREHSRAFEGAVEAVRALRGHGREHLMIDRNGDVLRLDIIEGTALAGPVSLRFELAGDAHLESRIGAIRAFASTGGPRRLHLQLASRIRALHATDAHVAGATLREIADLILGPGDWPGTGEYRKSLVRRMIKSGDRMVQAGPLFILTGAKEHTDAAVDLD